MDLPEHARTAYQHHLGRGKDADAAARAAIAETGDVAVITAEFTRQAPGRRTARLLLATGPAMGACWGTALISARAWTWLVPAGARIAFATALLTAIAGLAAAASTARIGYTIRSLPSIAAS
jgi:hypothetical protein